MRIEKFVILIKDKISCLILKEMHGSQKEVS